LHELSCGWILYTKVGSSWQSETDGDHFVLWAGEKKIIPVKDMKNYQLKNLSDSFYFRKTKFTRLKKMVTMVQDQIKSINKICVTVSSSRLNRSNQ
jgi:hypothetical protein